jgi:hypothetical protein
MLFCKLILMFSLWAKRSELFAVLSVFFYFFYFERGVEKGERRRVADVELRRMGEEKIEEELRRREDRRRTEEKRRTKKN